MLIFDIGANVGKWALANISNTNTIICVEASPKTFLSLSKTCSPYKSIKCLNFAVTNSNETHVEFYDSAVSTISTLDVKWLSDPSSRFYKYCPYTKISVPAISIDKLIEQHGTPDLIKIDVEGAENIVVKSLTKRTGLLCFEWASEWYDVLCQTVDHLKTIGYTKFEIQHGDNYTYRPTTLNMTSEDVKTAIKKTSLKQDWGMVWCL